MATTCEPPAIPVLTLKAITLPRVTVKLPVFELEQGRIRLVGWYVEPHPYPEWT